jgi:alpha-glucosidase
LASGLGGTLCIRFFSSEIVKVSYLFENVSIDRTLSESSDYMTEPSENLKWNDTLAIEEENTLFRITCNETTVEIEKSHAQVSIYFRGVLQHGGQVGNSDTVVPSYQIRCFTKEGETGSFSRFNFPLSQNDEFYGLGDKSGLPNRRGRRFAMFNRDSLGYDASNSDPLYKSIPFFLKVNTKNQVLCALLFDQTLVRNIDLGMESPYYYSIESEGGPYSFVVFLGENYHRVLSNYFCMTGFPALPPLFSFGFFGSSMNYAEPDDAQQRILDYFATIEKHHIPCEGMYVSSGYLKSPEGKRYAFLWNQKKFPDYRQFLTGLSKRGYNLCMNIKPGILISHPWYGELEEKGYFIQDAHGKAYREFFWGGEASFIDFNNPDAKAWWKSQLKKQYLDHGCTGIWNDNNELELEDVELEAYKSKAIYPVKMAEASFEVFKEEHPDKRPWVYSRSGSCGIQRYARTWSGDNVSDWKTLRYNQYMGIGFGLSGLPYFGHDLGGFFGAFPEEELLIRSCQSAVFQGRFVIHSWREDGHPTEPWSYATALAPIRSLIEEHYRFMPYIYNCAFEAALEGKPLERSLHLEFPQDEAIREDEVNSLFGPSILKVLGTEKDTGTAKVYLPKGSVWFDSERRHSIEGGTQTMVEYPCDGKIRWFAKEGSAIPTSPGLKHLDTGLFEVVEFLLFPMTKETEVCTTRYREDDGMTSLDLGAYNEWECTVGFSSLVMTKKKSRVQGKHRSFCFTVPQGYTIEDKSFDPDAVQEDESVTIGFQKTNDR